MYHPTRGGTHSSPPQPAAAVVAQGPGVARIRASDPYTDPPSVVDLELSEYEDTEGKRRFTQQQRKRKHYSICLLHTFGRCRGRNGEASSCLQLHISPSKARQQRQGATPRAILSDRVRIHIDQQPVLRKLLSLGEDTHCIRWPTKECEATVGLINEDNAFRAYLGNYTVQAFPPAYLCLNYFFSRNCDRRELCTGIHPTTLTFKEEKRRPLAYPSV